MGHNTYQAPSFGMQWNNKPDNVSSTDLMNTDVSDNNSNELSPLPMYRQDVTKRLKKKLAKKGYSDFTKN